MADIIILISFSLVFFFLVFENLRLKNKYIGALSDLLKSRMDNNIKDKMIKENVFGKPVEKTDEDEAKEHFIKFLSDSRDAAFLYIENVQKGIYDYINTVEPYIFSLENDVLTKELDKIKKLLPDDYGTMDK